MRIVIVEDNEQLANAIAYRLRDRGHAADILLNGTAAHDLLKSERIDLVVLDVNLPGMSGLEILASMRNRGDGTPVILLTARAQTHERVEGLDAGADDYLVKPFEMDELEARIRALSRRKKLEYAAQEIIGQLVFDRTSRQLTALGQAIDVPRREIAILECLLERRGRLVPKAQLIDHVYGIGADVFDSAIEPHVSRLRRRLEGCGIKIKTARGLGYMIDLDEP